MADQFKLFACCIPVKGASRSIICDVQRCKIKLIPDVIYQVLMNIEGATREEIGAAYNGNDDIDVIEWIDFFVENDFAFWCDNPADFPKIDMIWESPSKITNGIIDSNRLSKHDYKVIFEQYEELGCKHLQLRFFDEESIDYLFETLRLLDNSSINSVELILKFSPNISHDDLLRLCREFARISNLMIHSSPKFERATEVSEISPFTLTYFIDMLDSNVHCGNISLEYFVLDQDHFIEANSFNSCLNKKISIDVNGNIKNCPSLTKTYGNIKNDSLEDSLNQHAFQKLWNINKDQIQVCKDCEFRYICTDCRAFLGIDESLAKPQKCSYNPYLMQWEDS